VKEAFYALVDRLCRTLHAGETLLCSLSAEQSDFVRFNHARVRQAGTVEQRHLSLRLISKRRQASASVALSGEPDDPARCDDAIARLRDVLSQLPEDPWLAIAENPHSTADERRGRLPRAETIIEAVAAAAGDADFAGFYAGGAIFRGFANSLGQRNWHEVDSFNFDWSVYLAGDKAVKDGYAGFEWDGSIFESKLTASLERLELMRRPPVTLPPSGYRTYLAPRALEEITALLQWDSFSARTRATRQSALLRFEHGETLSPCVSMRENTQAGVAPAFQEDGFVRPPAVELISKGVLAESLVSARSAREYGLHPNGANSRESPESIELDPGSLDEHDILEALDTGLYVSNLWYLNFSDKPAARMTGMTRFATFWVENGRIVAPLTPLRFDDTLYRMLGEKLIDLTSSRELLLSTSTYDERSTSSARVPGALLESLRFTL
jgi:predicted Zn-dependent protease